MSPEMIALGRRATACKDWRWMPGMLVADVGKNKLGRVHKTGRDWIVYRSLGGETRERRTVSRMLEPDFSDPATLGCLLALVREAWGDPTAHAEPNQCGWSLYRCFAATEAEALVAALEGVP